MEAMWPPCWLRACNVLGLPGQTVSLCIVPVMWNPGLVRDGSVEGWVTPLKWSVEVTVKAAVYCHPSYGALWNVLICVWVWVCECVCDNVKCPSSLLCIVIHNARPGDMCIYDCKVWVQENRTEERNWKKHLKSTMTRLALWLGRPEVFLSPDLCFGWPCLWNVPILIRFVELNILTNDHQNGWHDTCQWLSFQQHSTLHSFISVYDKWHAFVVQCRACY